MARCMCGLPLVPGIRCTHGAAPGQSLKEQRHRRNQARLRHEQARIDAERPVLSNAEKAATSKRVAELDPMFAARSEMSRKAARKRHG